MSEPRKQHTGRRDSQQFVTQQQLDVVNGNIERLDGNIKKIEERLEQVVTQQQLDVVNGNIERLDGNIDLMATSRDWKNVWSRLRASWANSKT
ncbi:hypothetical protein ACA910_012096 [Epithemia clementina (nom. ined.)]